MEKLNFIDKILTKWMNLPPEKKVTYITGIIIITLGFVICFGYKHYQNELTKLENDKTIMKNECTINLNMVINRYDSLLSVEKENTRVCNENFIKFLEKNETEYKKILFYTKEYKKIKEEE